MQTRALIHALLAVLLWSAVAYLLLQLLHMPPMLVVGSALIVGAGCSLHKISQWRVSFKVLALGLYGLFGYHFCLFMAFRYAPPVETNLINYLWPLLTVVLTPLFLPDHPLKSRHLVAAFLGLAGAMLIVSGGRFDFRAEYLPGYGLAGAAAFMWASYSLMTKRAQPFPNAAIGLFCLCAGVLALSMHVLLEPPYTFTARDVTVLLLLGVGPMGSAFFLWDSALKNGDPRIIGSIAYLTPMLSTLLLLLTGSGALTAVSAIAMLFIIGGAAIGSVPVQRIRSKSIG
jgi:drug/metabolite transporter (DMT)-like permease